jgi:hypothetical protein
MTDTILGRNPRALVLLIHNKWRTINRSPKNTFYFGKGEGPRHATKSDFTGDIFVHQSRKTVCRRMIFDNNRVIERRHWTKREAMGEIMHEKGVGGGEMVLVQSGFKGVGVVRVDNTLKKLNVRRRVVRESGTMANSVRKIAVWQRRVKWQKRVRRQRRPFIRHGYDHL